MKYIWSLLGWKTWIVLDNTVSTERYSFRPITHLMEWCQPSTDGVHANATNFILVVQSLLNTTTNYILLVAPLNTMRIRNFETNAIPLSTKFYSFRTWWKILRQVFIFSIDEWQRVDFRFDMALSYIKNRTAHRSQLMSATYFSAFPWRCQTEKSGDKITKKKKKLCVNMQIVFYHCRCRMSAGNVLWLRVLAFSNFFFFKYFYSSGDT